MKETRIMNEVVQWATVIIGFFLVASAYYAYHPPTKEQVVECPSIIQSGYLTLNNTGIVSGVCVYGEKSPKDDDG